MSEVPTPSCCPNNEAEPVATRSVAPMWIIVVTLALLFFGGLYLDSHGGWGAPKLYAPYQSIEQLESFQPGTGGASLSRGKSSYDAVCGICHGADGLGKPGQAPALAGSEWVTAKNYNRLAHIPLAGLNGPIKVGGKDWNLAMAAMGAALPDENLAAVLTYIRSSWGNKAGEVTPDDIKKIRAEVGGSPQALSAEQLQAMPE